MPEHIIPPLKVSCGGARASMVRRSREQCWW